MSLVDCGDRQKVISSQLPVPNDVAGTPPSKHLAQNAPQIPKSSGLHSLGCSRAVSDWQCLRARPLLSSWDAVTSGRLTRSKLPSGPIFVRSDALRLNPGSPSTRTFKESVIAELPKPHVHGLHVSADEAGNEPEIRMRPHAVVNGGTSAMTARVAEPAVTPSSRTRSDDAEALLARVRAGDQNAVADLYDNYSAIVYSAALRVLADPAAAEDVLQEVFLQLWCRPEIFDARRGSLAAWLAVIARNRAIDQVRRQRPESDVDEVVFVSDAHLDDDVARAQAIERVREVLRELPAEQREALEMAFFDGLTHAEIAAQTGQPLGTVKTRIRSALIAVRRAVAKQSRPHGV